MARPLDHPLPNSTQPSAGVTWDDHGDSMGAVMGSKNTAAMRSPMTEQQVLS